MKRNVYSEKYSVVDCRTFTLKIPIRKKPVEQSNDKGLTGRLSWLCVKRQKMSTNYYIVRDEEHKENTIHTTCWKRFVYVIKDATQST